MWKFEKMNFFAKKTLWFSLFFVKTLSRRERRRQQKLIFEIRGLKYGISRFVCTLFVARHICQQRARFEWRRWGTLLVSHRFCVFFVVFCASLAIFLQFSASLNSLRPSFHQKILEKPAKIREKSIFLKKFKFCRKWVIPIAIFRISTRRKLRRSRRRRRRRRPRLKRRRMTVSLKFSEIPLKIAFFSQWLDANDRRRPECIHFDW